METLPFFVGVGYGRGMKDRPEQNDSYIDSILRSKQEELKALFAAIAAEESDIDMKIASMVEGESEEVKLAIVDHVRELLRMREAEKAWEAGLAMSADEKRVIEAERRSFRQWLTWLMSETTLKKLRLAALIPLLRQQGVKDIGQELAAKGVTLNVSTTNRKELGQLSSLVTQAKELNKDTGRGR